MPEAHPSGRRARPARAGAVRGLLAGAVGLLVAAVVDLILGGLGAPGVVARTPVAAVGATVIDAVPASVKDWAIAAFGTSDKAVLLAGVVLVLGALCALAGVLGARRPLLGRVIVASLIVLALGAVLSRPDAAAFDAIPTLVGGVLAVGLVGGRSATAGGIPRRDLLGLGASVVGIAALSPLAGGDRTAAQDSRRAVRLPDTPAAQPISSADLAVPGVSPWQVPASDFYRIDTALVVPRLTTADWSLRVWGEVQREVTIGWDELLSQSMVQRWVTLSCVSNEVGGDLVGNALWTGWPVREVLARAGVRPGADMVLSRSVDGWTAGTPLEALTDGREALLAIAMNGQPLPFEHGFPVRLVVPGLYGYVSATKWVTELKVTRFAADQGYWTPRGWSALGPVKTASRIEVPRSGATVPPGRVVVGGVAWAMHRGVTGVQVRVDGGAWVDVELATEPTIDAWRQWRFDWEATPGSHTVSVRARDGRGEWQTEQRAAPAPDGSTGHHSVVVRVG